MTGVRGRPRTGRHIFCPRCKAYFPSEGAFYRDLCAQWQQNAALKRAMLESRAARWIARAIREAGTTDPDDLADAVLRGLRRGFFEVDESYDLRRNFEVAFSRVVEPLQHPVRDILDGAFANFEGSFRLGQDRTVLVVVRLFEREPAQEAVVASRIESLDLPPEIGELQVVFEDREPEGAM